MGTLPLFLLLLSLIIMQKKRQKVQDLHEVLARNGLRSTRQREVVYQVVSRAKDHPTAEEIFSRCRGAMPTISIATVYNCLETLVACGLIRQVNFDRESSRYEPALVPHAHFFCDETGQVTDVELPKAVLEGLKGLVPESFSVSEVELNFRGTRAQLQPPVAAK